MRYLAIVPAVLALVLGCAAPARVAEPPAKGPEPLVGQVQAAIKGGVKYLKGQEAKRGNLEKSVDLAIALPPGGLTALATLAMLNAGESPRDETVQRCLAYLRTIKPDEHAATYVVSLQTMVYVLANQDEDKQRIEANVKWLLDARQYDRDGNFMGWTYGTGNIHEWDHSNTQYALLGLHEGHRYGARIDPAVWRAIRDHYALKDRTGRNYQSWGYKQGQAPIPTMTTAALCGMLIAGMELNPGRETTNGNGLVNNCGDYEKNEDLENALTLVGQKMPQRAEDIGRMPHTYYWLYGLERAGRLSGEHFIGGRDWYRMGCEYLIARQQKPEGAWYGEGHPVIATSFALLFLSKGLTPVLISKLVHGQLQEDGDNDWNSDRNDARNLTNYVSGALFRKTPLAWQVFDARRVGDLTDERIDQLTAELLQSPIAYINGHHAPWFTDGEEKLLKKYVENGGFLYAEACCGRQRGADFDRGFRALMDKLFGPGSLKRIPDEHALWTASGKFASNPRRHELWGIDMGCKTVVVYSPADHLCCWWEENQLENLAAQDAFQLGANIVAYATGMEPPKPRLTEMPVFKDDQLEKRIPRGYLKVGQVRHGGDWQAARQAMPNLMTEMRKLGLDVALQTEEIQLASPGSASFKFLYMHGRREFELSDKEKERLKFNLETGGVLLADACCGYKKSKGFDQAFRKLVKELWPDQPLEAIPLNDDLFGAELNGEAIKEVHCRHESPDGKGPEAEYRAVPPELEGIKVNGRWAVIYSKYDIGCALEKRPATDCLGHDFPSAVTLAKAAVLYAMKR
jgi:hypothetical protein